MRVVEWEVAHVMLVPSKIQLIVYPLQWHSLWLHCNKWGKRGHMRWLVWWQRWMRMQDVMVAGKKRRKWLVRDRKLLHGAPRDERRRKAAEGVVLAAEHDRTCWQLLGAAPWYVLPSVQREALGYSCNSI